MENRETLKAFTLVELSIVLVILGLLVGGVLTGQSLIHAAELRSVSTDFQRYQAATSAFRDKYFSLPGKMTNATLYWGKSSSLCNSASGTAATPGTCNGTGSGTLFTTAETLLFWQHLAAAGMIEGNYQGLATSADDYQTFGGVYGPKSKLATNAYFSIPTDPDVGGSPTTMTGTTPDYPPPMSIGYTGVDSAAGGTPIGAGGVLFQQDAYNIDKKMDDGVASTGKAKANFSDPYAGGIPDDSCSAYTLTDQTHKCALGFLIFQ